MTLSEVDICLLSHLTDCAIIHLGQVTSRIPSRKCPANPWSGSENLCHGERVLRLDLPWKIHHML